MSDNRHLGARPPKISRVEVYWTSVSYRTVALYAALGLVILITVLCLVNPNLYDTTLRRLSNALGASNAPPAVLTQTQARFVNLDGRVQVKKVNSVQWVAADYRTTLDKGDLIETGSDGAARITFADGTTYTVKADTLVTVEENIVQRDRTRVGVHISSGAVDLATGRAVSADSKADRKSTRLNSSHLVISYAVFCLKKKKSPIAHRRLDYVRDSITSTERT